MHHGQGLEKGGRAKEAKRKRGVRNLHKKVGGRATQSEYSMKASLAREEKSKGPAKARVIKKKKEPTIIRGSAATPGNPCLALVFRCVSLL